MDIFTPRQTLAAKLAEIEKQYPEADLNGGDYGRLNRVQQREMRATKARLVAEAQAECQRNTAKVTEAQRRKAAEFGIGTRSISGVDHAAVANVRVLLASGASPKKLIGQFQDDDTTLAALRWLVQNEGVGGESATSEQAEQLGGSSTMDAARRRLLHQIDSALDPDYAKQAEREHVDLEAAEAMEKGHDRITAIQAAQIASGRF